MASARRTLSKRGDSLKRPVGTRPPRKTVVVLCEGSVTEPDYLAVLKRLPEVREVAAVDLIVDSESHGSAPITMVNRAVEIVNRSTSDAGEIDEVWCVFDVEWTQQGQHHPNLQNAIKLAKDNGIFVAISNPCFELWLILHHRDQTAFMSNVEARRIRAECDGSRDKRVNAGAYMPLRSEAVRRATLLTRRHHEDGTKFPHDNPSSGMYELLRSIGA